MKKLLLVSLIFFAYYSCKKFVSCEGKPCKAQIEDSLSYNVTLIKANFDVLRGNIKIPMFNPLMGILTGVRVTQRVSSVFTQNLTNTYAGNNDLYITGTQTDSLIFGVYRYEYKDLKTDYDTLQVAQTKSFPFYFRGVITTGLLNNFVNQYEGTDSLTVTSKVSQFGTFNGQSLTFNFTIQDTAFIKLTYYFTK